MSSKVNVSFLIPIKNEAGNLPRCLDSIKWADEIVIVDSQSTDQSVMIAESYGASVHQFNYNGKWPKKKNWSLENIDFKNEWVFILDADEVLPRNAREEIDRIVSENGSKYVGYWINRRFMFMGKWLKHSYYPNWNLRLFKHKLGRYEKITGAETKSGDNEVHEHIVIQGETGRLSCEMDHFAFPSVDVFIEKHNRYSNWEARVNLEPLPKSGSSDLQNQRVRTRRYIKNVAKHLPFRPFLRFFYVFVWQRGFLDGIEGYYFARLHALYEFLSIAKTYELKKQKLNQYTRAGNAPEDIE